MPDLELGRLRLIAGNIHNLPAVSPRLQDVGLSPSVPWPVYPHVAQWALVSSLTIEKSLAPLGASSLKA